MKITKEEVIHVADLARTEGIEPTSHAISLTNAFRNDEEKEHLDRDLVLQNAPDRENGNFIVPKVVG
jgi:aspartyl-tRNA(Asn)/glutamyl-tRNA(Gln) amidotransferase subunit C